MNNNVYYTSDNSVESVGDTYELVYFKKEKDNHCYIPIIINNNSWVFSRDDSCWIYTSGSNVKLLSTNNILSDTHILNLNIEQLNTLGWILTEFYNEISDDKAKIVMEVINKIEELG